MMPIDGSFMSVALIAVASIFLQGLRVARRTLETASPSFR
jgi:hypothetical protein